MPMLILSFDMNTAGPKNGQARKTFESALKDRGWTDEISAGGKLETLPATTLVAERTDALGVKDVSDAELAAKREEPAFKVTRFVLSGYRRVGSQSDKSRPGPSTRDLLRAIGRT